MLLVDNSIIPLLHWILAQERLMLRDEDLFEILKESEFAPCDPTRRFKGAPDPKTWNPRAPVGECEEYTHEDDGGSNDKDLTDIIAGLDAIKVGAYACPVPFTF